MNNTYIEEDILEQFEEDTSWVLGSIQKLGQTIYRNDELKQLFTGTTLLDDLDKAETTLGNIQEKISEYKKANEES